MTLRGRRLGLFLSVGWLQESLRRTSTLAFDLANRPKEHGTNSPQEQNAARHKAGTSSDRSVLSRSGSTSTSKPKRRASLLQTRTTGRKGTQQVPSAAEASAAAGDKDNKHDLMGEKQRAPSCCGEGKATTLPPSSGSGEAKTDPDGEAAATAPKATTTAAPDPEDAGPPDGFKSGLTICIPPVEKNADADWKKCNLATKKAMDGGNKCEDGCQQHFGPPFGRLRVRGTDGCKFNTCGADGKGVSLRGMSWYWHLWSPAFWKPQIVVDLKKKFCATVARFAIGAGYRWTKAGPVLLKQLMKTAIRVGLYAVMDWHTEGDMGSSAHSARNYWLEWSSIFGRYPNALYETWNEPKGWENSWAGQVKPWHSMMIAAIRQNSDNIITLGSPQWSSQPQLGVPDICHGAWAATKNIQMTIHQYSATNHDRSHATNTALNPMKGCGRGGLFMSEWGACESNGNGRLDFGSADQWATWCHQESIAMINWSLSNIVESCSAIRPGLWTLDPGNLSPSGNHVLNTLIWQYNVKWFGKKGKKGNYNLRCNEVKPR